MALINSSEMQIKYHVDHDSKRKAPTGNQNLKIYDQIIDSPKYKSKLLARSNQLRKRAEELEKKYRERRGETGEMSKISGAKGNGEDPLLRAKTILSSPVASVMSGPVLDQAKTPIKYEHNVLRQSKHKKQILNHKRFINRDLQQLSPSGNTQSLLQALKVAQVTEASLGIHGVGHNKYQALASGRPLSEEGPRNLLVSNHEKRIKKNKRKQQCSPDQQREDKKRSLQFSPKPWLSNKNEQLAMSIQTPDSSQWGGTAKEMFDQMKYMEESQQRSNHNFERFRQALLGKGSPVPRANPRSLEDAGQSPGQSPASRLQTTSFGPAGHQMTLQGSRASNVGQGLTPTKGGSRLIDSIENISHGPDQAKDAQQAGGVKNAHKRIPSIQVEIAGQKTESRNVNSSQMQKSQKSKKHSQCSVDDADDDIIVMSIDRSKNSSKYYQYEQFQQLKITDYEKKFKQSKSLRSRPYSQANNTWGRNRQQHNILQDKKLLNKAVQKLSQNCETEAPTLVPKDLNEDELTKLDSSNQCMTPTATNIVTSAHSNQTNLNRLGAQKQKARKVRQSQETTIGPMPVQTRVVYNSGGGAICSPKSQKAGANQANAGSILSSREQRRTTQSKIGRGKPVSTPKEQVLNSSNYDQRIIKSSMSKGDPVHLKMRNQINGLRQSTMSRLYWQAAEPSPQHANPPGGQPQSQNVPSVSSSQQQRKISTNAQTSDIKTNKQTSYSLGKYLNMLSVKTASEAPQSPIANLPLSLKSDQLKVKSRAQRRKEGKSEASTRKQQRSQSPNQIPLSNMLIAQSREARGDGGAAVQWAQAPNVQIGENLLAIESGSGGRKCLSPKNMSLDLAERNITIMRYNAQQKSKCSQPYKRAVDSELCIRVQEPRFKVPDDLGRSFKLHPDRQRALETFMKRFKSPKSNQIAANKAKNRSKKLSYNRGSETPSLLKSLNQSIDKVGKNQDCTEVKMEESIKHERKRGTSPDEGENQKRPSDKNRVMTTLAHNQFVQERPLAENNIRLLPGTSGQFSLVSNTIASKAIQDRKNAGIRNQNNEQVAANLQKLENDILLNRQAQESKYQATQILALGNAGNNNREKKLPDTLEQPLIILSADPGSKSDLVTTGGANNGGGETDPQISGQQPDETLIKNLLQLQKECTDEFQTPIWNLYAGIKENSNLVAEVQRTKQSCQQIVDHRMFSRSAQAHHHSQNAGQPIGYDASSSAHLQRNFRKKLNQDLQDVRNANASGASSNAPTAALDKAQRGSLAAAQHSIEQNLGNRQAPGQMRDTDAKFMQKNSQNEEILQQADDNKPPQPFPVSPDVSDEFSSRDASQQQFDRPPWQRKSPAPSIAAAPSRMDGARSGAERPNEVNRSFSDINEEQESGPIIIKTATLSHVPGQYITRPSQDNRIDDEQGPAGQQITLINIGSDMPPDLNPYHLHYDHSTGIYHTNNPESNYLFIPAFPPYRGLPAQPGLPTIAGSPSSLDGRQIQSEQFDLSVPNLQNMELLRSLNSLEKVSMKVTTFECPLPELPRSDDGEKDVASWKDALHKREKVLSEGKLQNVQGQATQISGSKSNQHFGVACKKQRGRGASQFADTIFQKGCQRPQTTKRGQCFPQSNVKVRIGPGSGGGAGPTQAAPIANPLSSPPAMVVQPTHDGPPIGVEPKLFSPQLVQVQDLSSKNTGLVIDMNNQARGSDDGAPRTTVREPVRDQQRSAAPSWARLELAKRQDSDDNKYVVSDAGLALIRNKRLKSIKKLHLQSLSPKAEIPIPKEAQQAERLGPQDVDTQRALHRGEFIQSNQEVQTGSTPLGLSGRQPSRLQSYLPMSISAIPTRHEADACESSQRQSGGSVGGRRGPASPVRPGASKQQLEFMMPGAPNPTSPCNPGFSIKPPMGEEFDAQGESGSSTSRRE